MSVTITRPFRDRVEGNKRVNTRDLVFSSTYTTGGEAITPSTVGLKKIEFVRFSGPAMTTDLVTANAVSFNAATNKILQYESGASGAATIEKTSGETYATGSAVRAEFVGFGGI